MINHFQSYLLSTFILQKFFKFCNHLIINSKKITMIYYVIFNYFQSFFFDLCRKQDHFLVSLEIITFFVYFTMLSPWTFFEGVKDSIGNGSKTFVLSIGHGKLKQMAWFFFLHVFCNNAFELHEDWALVYYYYIIYLSTKFSIVLFESKP